MMSRKIFTIFSQNFKILCSTVKMKPSTLTVLKQSCHSSNNINTAVFSMKRYCTGNDEQKVVQTTTEPKNSISEEDKIEIKKSEEDKSEIKKWIEMCKFEGKIVPKSISDEQFMELYDLPSKNQKKKYLNFLVIKEAAKANNKLLKERRRSVKADIQMKRKNRPRGHIKYGLWDNAMFAKINKKHMNDLYLHKLASAMIHGQPLVIDLGYENHMMRRELSSYANQLQIAINRNKINDEPFNLTFCNANFESKGFQKLIKRMPNIIKPSYPMNITSDSYLDMFPKNKIVYLSPNARDEMRTFDDNAVYVIGGIVKVNKPLTLAKSKKENVKVQKLPLDRYHVFKGRKTLEIHVVLAILLDVRKDGDWKHAFRHIPRRLLQTADETHTTWDEITKIW